MGDQGIDAVPWGVGRLYVNHMRWQPRPVLQDYAAYSPALDALDAQHVLGSSGASWILLAWRYQHLHHPFLETPLLWRAICDRYDLTARDGGVLLLGRGQRERFGPLQRVTTFSVAWKEELSLPDAPGLLLLSARIEPSALGRIHSALIRDTPTYLRTTFLSGASTSWRIVVPNLASGAIVSSFPRGAAEMASFLDPAHPLERTVRSIRFETESPGRFRPTIEGELSILPIKSPTAP